MSDGMDVHSSEVLPVRMPQANVNDEEVTLVNWCVPDGHAVAEGGRLCEVETSKSVNEMPSPAGGILRHAAGIGDVIAVGEVFAYIGHSLEAIDAYIASHGGPKDAGNAGPGRQTTDATAGAVELAARHGISLSEIPASGKLRRADVERFIAQRGSGRPAAQPAASREGSGDTLPPGLADRVSQQGELSDHQWAVARHLEHTQSRLVAAHVVMDADMSAALAWIDARRGAGVMTGPVPVLLHAAAVAIAAEPKLASFRLGRRVYRYHATDIAYTARSADGRLFTPVVRHVDRLSVEAIAAECGRLNMAVFRGQLAAEDMIAGAMTVSVLGEQPVRFHIGVQNAWQSALLTAGAIRDELKLIDGEPAAVPTITLTLSYDHGLLDGWEAAAALQHARAAIEQVQV